MYISTIQGVGKKTIVLFTLLFAAFNFSNAQMRLPAGVSYFPNSLGPLADTAFYSGTIPMFNQVNWQNDLTGNDKNIFILTLSRISNPLDTSYNRIVYPSQAVLLSADTSGVFPVWQLNFKDDTTPEPTRKPLGIFRYHPQYGIYTVMKQDAKREDRGTLIILDSTFHKIDVIPNLVANSHDYQLTKMPNGNWQFVTTLAAPPKYFDKEDKTYEITCMVYDHNIFKRQLWSCGPTIQTVDSAEWYPIFHGCQALPKKAYNPNDMFHANSWQSFPWSKDSLLVAVSEKNDNKIRFWWIVDSAGRWVTRGMFRLGCQKDAYNNFTFPTDPGFQISGGHNFRMLGKHQNEIIATYYDLEECDTLLSARGLVLSLDFEKKTCRILQQTIQGGHEESQGSMQLMLDETQPVTPQLALNANRCMDWGGWNKFYTGVTSGYFPNGDTGTRLWELGVLNPKSQPIVGITITDLGNYSHQLVVSNCEYQAQARYKLPIPSSPITCTLKGDKVTFTTALVNPTWITGAKTPSITLPLRKKTDPKATIWVRGKTDETMVGEIWERINFPSK